MRMVQEEKTNWHEFHRQSFLLIVWPWWTWCLFRACWKGAMWFQVFRCNNTDFRASFRLETCKICVPALNGTCRYLRHCGSSNPSFNPHHRTQIPSQSGFFFPFSPWAENFPQETLFRQQRRRPCATTLFLSPLTNGNICVSESLSHSACLGTGGSAAAIVLADALHKEVGSLDMVGVWPFKINVQINLEFSQYLPIFSCTFNPLFANPTVSSRWVARLWGSPSVVRSLHLNSHSCPFPSPPHLHAEATRPSYFLFLREFSQIYWVLTDRLWPSSLPPLLFYPDLLQLPLCFFFTFIFSTVSNLQFKHASVSQQVWSLSTASSSSVCLNTVPQKNSFFHVCHWCLICDLSPHMAQQFSGLLWRWHVLPGTCESLESCDLTPVRLELQIWDLAWQKKDLAWLQLGPYDLRQKTFKGLTFLNK